MFSFRLAIFIIIALWFAEGLVSAWCFVISVVIIMFI